MNSSYVHLQGPEKSEKEQNAILMEQVEKTKHIEWLSIENLAEHIKDQSHSFYNFSQLHIPIYLCVWKKKIFEQRYFCVELSQHIRHNA